jgi:2-oxoglutarate dehydrogenase E2 component (dihydrolipoamide succinyltransferase)
MPVSVTMPRLGESVTEGTVTRWLKQEGDRVEVDEPLLEVSTDKVDTEIPSPAAGVLSRIVVGEDETAEVGSELAQIDGDGDGGDSGGGGGGGGAAAEETSGEAPAEESAEAEPEAPSADEPADEPTDKSADEPADEPESPAKPARSESAASDGTVVRMPALGESVTEGTVTRWLKQVGDAVEADEPLLEVSTDKVDTEIPSPTAGTLLEIKVPEDETAAVGAELAVIGGGQGEAAQGEAAQGEAAQDEAVEGETAQDESAPDGKSRESSAPAEKAPTGKAPAEKAPQRASAERQAPGRQATTQEAPARQASQRRQATPQTVNGGSDTSYVTPLVRRLAAEHGVDLTSLSGTGVGGRIRKQDVLDAAERAKAAAAAQAASPKAAAGAPPKAQPSPLRGRTEKMSRMRALIARRMVESLQVSAQLTTVVEVDVTKIARLRGRAKAEFQSTHGVKLSFLPFFALAAVEALRVHPGVNASIDIEAGTVTYHDAEHLGVAVDTERGLLVPVIHDAGDLNLAGLAKRIADVAARSRNNKISPDELSGGTFTLTNTGSRGALFDTPIINQPQVAILGTGAVVKRAVVVDDPNLGELILPRSMVYLSLSYDHRLVDGADAARFLSTIKDRLEGGAFETELGLS